MKKCFVHLILSTLLLVIVTSSFAHGEGTKISDVGVKYDPDLVRAFEDRDFAEALMAQEDFIGLQIIDDEVWARVMIVLKDNSGIIVEGNKSQRAELVNQRVAWFKQGTERLISSLHKEDIKEINSNSGGFSALISNKGLNELISREEIEAIVWEQYGPKLLGRNDFKNKPEILLLAFSVLFLGFLVYLLFRIKRKKK